MLEFLKNYYVFMLILMVVSYLVPKESYKSYIQFFIGIFIIVLLLEPVLKFLTADNPAAIYQVFQDMNQQIEGMDLQIETEEGLFEHFFFEGEEK